MKPAEALRVARWLTVVSSALLLLGSGFSLTARMWYLVTHGWGAVPLTYLILALLLMLSVYGLWAMVSSSGQQAFDAYVRR